MNMNYVTLNNGVENYAGFTIGSQVLMDGGYTII